MLPAKISSLRLILIGLGSLVVLFIISILVVIKFGEYRQRQLENSLKEIDAQNIRSKLDIAQLRLTFGTESIDILSNGTIIRTTVEGQKTAILGYGSLRDLFSRLKVSKLSSTLNYLNGSGQVYTLTITTPDGQVVTINAQLNDPNLPPDIQNIITVIENTANQTLNPTPTPTVIPSQTPTISPTPGVTNPSPTPPNVPSPTPLASPGATPTIPPYLTKPPFTCEDLNLVKETMISNVICTPQ